MLWHQRRTWAIVGVHIFLVFLMRTSILQSILHPAFAVLKLPTAMTSNPINVLTTTAEELQRLLQQNTVTSKQLVTTYLKQIEKHNPYLHAVIETTPEDILYKTAETLDAERASGKVRSRLHGIPVLVKVTYVLQISSYVQR